MTRIVVEKSKPLRGTVKINGAKNAVLPIIAATLLVDDVTVIRNVPKLRDVNIMIDLLTILGAKVDYDGYTLTVDAKNVNNTEAPLNLVSKMRASFLVMGSLLSRFKNTKVYLPGGCAIGDRPIDLHLKGFKQLGANIEENVEEGYIFAKTEKLTADKIYLDFPSVGATENIIMAAVLAEGITIIENAAEEPEIVDLANFLNKIGAKVRGAGTNTIKITGVDKLHSAEHTVIPDRIEAGTYMVAGAITKGDITLENIIVDHIKPIIAKLKETGASVIEYDSSVRVVGTDNIKATNIKTLPHPGFPTDMQSQFLSLLSIADGESIITETIFENRFMTVPELVRLGSNIEISGESAIIRGSKVLIGSEVIATDLRAGAGLVLAGLAAEGKTTIKNIDHILRGYVDLVEQLRNLGAEIYYDEEE